MPTQEIGINYVEDRPHEILLWGRAKALALASRYPASSVQSASQFKQMHQFILEAWEALYRTMLHQFISSQDAAVTLVKNIEEDGLWGTYFKHKLHHHLEFYYPRTKQFHDEFNIFTQEEPK